MAQTDPAKKIVSVSRRTDIPAFYGAWFAQRLRDGFAGYVNPFGGRRHLVSLAREHVACFVFWSKNFTPFMDTLRTIRERGDPALFHFTITGLPDLFEQRTPDPDTAVDTLRELSSLFTPRQVFWRYDPVFLTDVTDRAWHLDRFKRLAAALEGYTKRCFFSFVAPYKKLMPHFAALKNRHSVHVHSAEPVERKDLALALAHIACEHGMALYTCCCADLVHDPLIHKAHCVDGALIAELFGARLFRENPTREGCGCAESRDIGAYDTCPHACVYCYANTNKITAAKAYDVHDPRAVFLGYSKEKGQDWLRKLRAAELARRQEKTPSNGQQDLL